MGKNADVLFGSELIDRKTGKRASFEAIADAATGIGVGDMVKATYDPTLVGGDVFAMDNMVEGANTKILTAQERQDIIDSFSMGNMVETATAKVFTDVERTALANLVSPAQVVNVNAVGDFPAPVGGVITLVSGVTYKISGNVNIGTNTIVFGSGSGLVGTNRFTDFLTYTGAGTLFTANGVTHKIQELGIIASSGTVLALSNGASNTAVYTNSYIVSCTNVGNVADWRNLSFRSFSIVGATTSGLTFSGTCTDFSMDNSLLQGITGAAIDLGIATFDRVQLGSGNRFVLPSPAAIGISGAASSANINAGGAGVVASTIFQTTGGGVALSGINKLDLLWEFRDNIGVPNSDVHGSVQATGNVIATDIVTQNVWVQVAVTTVSAVEMARVSSPSASVLQVDKLGDSDLHVFAALSFDKVGGGSDTYEFAIFVDTGAGFQIFDADQTVALTTSSGTIVQASITSFLTLKATDKVAVFVRNTTGTSDLTVRDFQLAVKAG